MTKEGSHRVSEQICHYKATGLFQAEMGHWNVNH